MGKEVKALRKRATSLEHEVKLLKADVAQLRRGIAAVLERERIFTRKLLEMGEALSKYAVEQDLRCARWETRSTDLEQGLSAIRSHKL